MKTRNQTFPFVAIYSSLTEVLTGRRLSSLGDSFVNFVYSLALSNKKGRPVGVKVKSSVLAEALKRAGLRSLVPSSVSSHTLADAAEALLLYGWVENCITLKDYVIMLEKNEDPVEGFRVLLQRIRSQIKIP